MKKKTWIIAGLIFFALFYWLYKVATKPLPGEAVTPMGRDHVTDIAGVTYNSNPPTSGSHFPVWAKPGVYDRLISDGYFIHSMEHGYIIISYDCTKLISNSKFIPRSGLFISNVYAHDEPAQDSTDSGELLKHMKVSPQTDMSWFTPENQPEVEVELPESFKSDACKNLVGQLSEFTKVAKRVIVTPRINMDTAIALTAWGRIDKMNSVDKDRIEKFIKAFHDHGPEKTME